MTDYVLEDWSRAYWPGVMPYRGTDTPRGRGYRTREDAEQKARVVTDDYAAAWGSLGGPDLRVVEREGKR